MNSFLFQVPALLIAVVLFGLMIAFNLAGFYLRQKNADATTDGLGPVEGSLLGLLALLLSFTFSMSASKSDTRRQIIVDEANRIGTAILRCDLYPDTIRKELHGYFYNYVDARVAYYNAGVDTAKLNQSLQKTNTIADKIWKRVTALSKEKDNTLRSQQMIPAVNDMIDIVTTRDAERNAHVPESILWMLFLLTLTGSFITGYGLKKERFNWVIVSGFALMTTLAIYLILDLDRPRRGIINMDETHHKVIELKDLLKDR